MGQPGGESGGLGGHNPPPYGDNHPSSGGGGGPYGEESKSSSSVTVEDLLPGKNEPILHFIRAFFVGVCAQQGRITSNETVAQLLGINCAPIWQDLFTLISTKKDVTGKKYDTEWLQSILNLPFALLS